MQKEKGLKSVYNRICDLLSVKNITWLAIGVFILIMIPVCYLSFVNRASGDDYGYGAYTRIAWVETHSIVAVMKAVWATIKQYYYGWQGTWFSIFYLDPETSSG